ncbi:MAG TPA: FtsX-like permease family protein [bacterium]|nr:FtsX-like permease family protein [bacterium]HPQ66928.1 FtsX-like permease family protein [bacterium]
MRILDRKLLRDLASSWRLLSAVVAILAAGIASFVSMLTAYANLEKSRAAYYDACRMADFWIEVKKAPVPEVARLASLDDVARVRTRVTAAVRVVIPGADRPVGGLLMSMPEEAGAAIDDIVVRSGSYFTPGVSNQVIVSEKFADARGLGPGDTLDLIVAGRQRSLRVVGTAISPEFIYLTAPGTLMDTPGAYGVFFVKRSYAEDTLDFAGACNGVVGIFRPGSGPGERRLALKELTARLEPYGVFSSVTRRNQFSNMMLSSEMQGLQSLATILPLLFLGVAALVLNVLLSRMAQQQRTVVGTLKALGYGNRTLLGHYLLFSVVVGLAGGVAGCLIGHALGSSLTGYYRNFFTFPILIDDVYPGLWGLSWGIALLFAVLGAARGIRSVARLEPAEAMHPPPPAVGGAIALEKIPSFWNRLTALQRVTVRNLFRNRLRTAGAVVAGALGAFILLLALGFVDSLDFLIDFQFDKVMRADFHLGLRDYRGGGALLEAAALPGVAAAEPVFNLDCTFFNRNHSKKGTIAGILPGGSLTVPCAADGRRVLVPPSGLLVPERLAEQLEVNAGERLAVVPVRGASGTVSLPVAGIIRSMLGLTVYADYSYLNRIMGETGAMDTIEIKTDGSEPERREFLREVSAMPEIEGVGDTRAEKLVLSRQFSQGMMTMAAVMIVFAAVIFFGSILNGSFISLEERRREVATLRVLGYTPRQVGALFFRESLATNMAGTLAGIPLAYLGIGAMMTSFRNDFYAFPAVISPISVVYTVVLAALFVFISQWVVMRSIRSMDWVEALSIKE